jgi:hypothetical protein
VSAAAGFSPLVFLEWIAYPHRTLSQPAPSLPAHPVLKTFLKAAALLFYR